MVCISDTMVLMSVDMPVDVPPLDVELRTVGVADWLSGTVVGCTVFFVAVMAGNASSSSRSKWICVV